MPANEGLNSPVCVFVIPLPDQIPPELTADKLTTGSFKQYGPAGLIEALVLLVTTIST